MSGALLVENKLHRAYWRKITGVETGLAYVGSTTSGYDAPAEGFSFANALDDNGGTSFMIQSFGKQVDATLTFPSALTFNGFAVYGHNLTSNQGLKIKYSTSDTGTTNFNEFKATPYTSNEYKPSDNSFKPFGALFSSTITGVRRLRFETIAWNSKNFITIISAGMWVSSGINITAPFVPPSFAPHEVSMKRNNKGNHLLSDVRKVPQKLNIKLTRFSEDDLYTTTDTAQNTIINGLNTTHPFIDYMGHFMSRHPFFLMYQQGNASDSNSVRISDQQKIYFCNISKQLDQPKFSSPTLLDWSIKCLGYVE